MLANLEREMPSDEPIWSPEDNPMIVPPDPCLVPGAEYTGWPWWIKQALGGLALGLVVGAFVWMAALEK